MTLLEQAISSAVAAILITGSSISWIGFVNAQNVKVDADKVQSALYHAQSEAKLGKLMSEYLFRQARTEQEYNLAEALDTAYIRKLEAVLDNSSSDPLSLPSVQYRNKMGYSNLAELRTMISLELQNASLPYASKTPTLPVKSVSISAPFSEQLAELDSNIAKLNHPTAIDLIDMSQIDDKATKAVPKLKYFGCYASNGVVSVQTASGLTAFNPAMLPAGTVVTLKLSNCPNVPTK